MPYNSWKCASLVILNHRNYQAIHFMVLSAYISHWSGIMELYWSIHFILYTFLWCTIICLKSLHLLHSGHSLPLSLVDEGPIDPVDSSHKNDVAKKFILCKINTQTIYFDIEIVGNSAVIKMK